MTHLFKKRWYKVDMAKFARETLAEVSNGDQPKESLRNSLTLGQVNTLYLMAGEI